MRPPRGIVFDLDGTLIDSLGDIAAALGSALAASGRATPTVEAVKGMVGCGARRLVERALEASGAPFTDEEAETVLGDFLGSYVQDPIGRTRLYPGMDQVLAALRRDGFALAIATNKPQDLAEAVVAALGLRGAFVHIAGARPGLALKPAPDLVRSASAALGMAAEDVIMVGDSVADVKAAHAAGCRVVAVGWGYSRRLPEALGADAVVHTTADLLAALRSPPAVQPRVREGAYRND